MDGFSTAEIERFHREGYRVARGLAPADRLAELNAAAREALARREAPLELEAEVGYPGAPADRGAAGGDTPRRLLAAWDRHPAFRRWAADPRVTVRLGQLLAGAPLFLSQAHHNCLMTKMPGHSSATGWHRDVRYWSFSDPELVNAWLALGPESEDNGCLHLIPGSHRMDLEPERFDGASFLRAEHPANRALVETAVRVELAPGDALFFHARALHAAGRNRSAQPKLALVFTYHGPDTVPAPGTRSASRPEIDVTAP